VAKDLLTDKDSPGEEDLVSPLQGKSLPRVVVTIAVAIAVPGGLYLLAALVVLPLITRYLLRRADKRKESGELKKALKTANRAVRLSRKSATALAHRGLVHIEAGDLDSALTDAELAIERKPKVALPYRHVPTTMLSWSGIATRIIRAPSTHVSASRLWAADTRKTGTT
jgi:tetratricopeptide (TPR) repeat protein